jgi:biotin carboxylase
MSGTVVFLEPKGTILEVIRAAKEEGFKVVAIVSDPDLLAGLPDPYKSALPCIDHIVRIRSWSDWNEVSAAVGQLKAVEGMYFGVDGCAVAGALLRGEIGLPTTLAPAMELVLDKHRLRMRLREAGLSKLQAFHGSSVDKWTGWNLRGAGYFKPVHGSFSMYVARCNSLAELRKAKQMWESGERATPKFIADYLMSRREYHLEEAFDGELMSVEAIVFRGEFLFIGLTSRILYSEDPTVEMGSCFPYPHPLLDRIISLVRAAHSAVGFSDGPSHTELIVEGSGDMEIIDFNPRFVGADVLQSINNAYGIRIERALLDYAVGRRPSCSFKPIAFSCLQYFLPPQPLTIESIDFPDAPEVKFHTSFVQPGTKITEVGRQIDYLGCYLTVMPTFEEALARSHDLRTRVLINNKIPPAY